MPKKPLSPDSKTWKRLSEAVRKYNAAVTRMEKSGLYDVVPNRTTVEAEKAVLRNRDQVYARVKQLGRILKVNNPTADKPVEIKLAGDITAVVPDYLMKEVRYSRQAKTEEAKARRERLYSDFTEMSEVARATAMANKNIGPFADDGYDFDEDYNFYPEYDEPPTVYELVEMGREDTALYADQYLAVWDEMGGNDELGEIINRFLEENPDALIDIFDSGDTRIDIEYIYPDKPSSGRPSQRGYKYERLSAFLDPLAGRMNKVMEFWREMEAEYLD